MFLLSDTPEVEGTRLVGRKRIPAKVSYAEWRKSVDSGKIVTRGLAAGNAISTKKAGVSPYLIGKINLEDSQRVFDYFEQQIADAAIENGIIITRAGEIYHCTGELNTLETIEELGDKLIGAQVTHNHPVGSVNEYSFSEVDIALFQKYNLERLRGIDEFFIYEFTRDSDNIDESLPTQILDEYSHWHAKVVEKAKKLGIGYRRWSRE